MKNKDLILILAYCPTPEKKEVLYSFLVSIQKFRNNYDILVSSHSPLDPWFFSYFDYFYFDKNNELLTDIEYRQNGWFRPWDNYVIWSNYIEVGNTLWTILNMLVPSLSISRTLGYDKIHYFEYDTVLKDDLELRENSNLLEEYNYVIYGNETTHKLVGAFLSFRSDGIIESWKKLDLEIMKSLFYDKYPKVPENIIFDEINLKGSYIKKDPNLLEERGVILNKVRGNPYSWNVPFYDGDNNRLKFVSKNNTQDSYKIRVIANDVLYNLGEISPNSWKIVDLVDFGDIKKLIVFKDDLKTLDLDFEDDDYKNRFIKYNSALTNDSLT